MPKKQEQRRRSLNDRIDAAVAADFNVAGITADPVQQPTESSVTTQPKEGRGEDERQPKSATPDFQTKKATTIMPKEVFAALQHYCTDTDTPKHRAIYRFIIDGLHAANAITDDDHQRFSDMASQLTTTYGKK